MPRFLRWRDDPLDLADRDRVDAGERLVEQHQPRLGGQRACDLAAPALAAGQARAQLVGHVRDLQFVHQAGQLAFAAVGVQVLAQLQHQAQVVGDGELAEHRWLLRQVADAELGARVHGLGGDVAAIELDAAGIGRHQADDHVETGGLAGAVGAEQADDLAGVEGQREIVDDFARPVALAQSLGDQHHFLSLRAGAAGRGRCGGRRWRSALQRGPACWA